MSRLPVERVGAPGRALSAASDELWERMWASSVDVPGPLVDRLVAACARARRPLAIGVNEREDDRPGSLYNTLLVLGPDGVMLAATASSCPRMHERVFHGIGAGDDLEVADTAGVGPRRRADLLGEPDAARPLGACTRAGRRSGSRRPPTTATAGSPRMRHIAIESGAFVVCVPQYIPRCRLPGRLPAAAPRGRRCSATAARLIVDPAWGEVIAGPLYGEEGIVDRRLRPSPRPARQALLRRGRPLRPRRRARGAGPDPQSARRGGAVAGGPTRRPIMARDVAAPAQQHPQLLDHRPHRPREVDAGRPHPRGHRRGRRAQPQAADARLDGPRARARDHDQGPGGARRVQGARRRDLPPPPDRHARPRRLLLRGLALARGVRRRAPRGRRVPGRRGADDGQHLPGGRGRPRADPRAEQDRPARRRAGARGGRDRRAAGRGRRRAADLGEDGGGDRGDARGDRAADPAARGRRRGAAARADLRLRVRPVPRRRRLRARRRRRAAQARPDRGDAERHRGRHRRHRLLRART